MKLTKNAWISLGLLIGISALAYLPLIHKLGYINDDWYLMYDVRVHGSQFFHDMFSSDRPGRAYLMIPLYSLFGLNPLSYNLSAYLFRVLGGISLLWTLRMLWPDRRRFAFTAALLFTIYPGFLSQINAIDYQSHLVALFLAILSVALTLKAVFVANNTSKIVLTIFSIMTGLAALSQMEYYLGIEVFRLACIGVLVWRSGGMNFIEKSRAFILKWLPFSLIPVGFLFWRILLFQAKRKATDLGSQLGRLFSSPLTGLWWLTYLLQGFFNVLLAPWVIPFSLFALSMRLQNQLIGVGLAVVAIIPFIWVENLKSEAEPALGQWEMREQLFVGLLGIAGGLAPVIAANRHIIFPDYSRYTLIASIGAGILLSAFIQQFSSKRLGIYGTGLSIGISVMTHYGNAVKTAADTDEVRNFWWQVAWRAPQIEAKTTLSVTYPNVAIQEDYFIWGAANHIYYPDAKEKDDLQVQLPALVLNDYTVSRILVGRGEDTYFKRGDVEVVNEYDRVLILAQAATNSCVRILDGNAPDLSASDQPRVLLVSPYSKLGTVITSENPPNPSEDIFGEEPAHEWCYYYQKADLARQRGLWNEVAKLYEEADQNGFRPNDQIELMPFLQAYAYLGDQNMVRELSKRVNTNIFYTMQACQRLSDMTTRGYPITSEMYDHVKELFCK